MSTTIDNRAVQLGFDNRQFESGVKNSVDSLHALKKGLDLTESARSLEKLGAAGKNFSLGPIGEGVQAISNRFSTLGIIGMTIIQNLTNAAIDLGRKMWTSITGPAKAGFGEYETQMNAIQTIMANTASKGTTLQEVNDILEEMNLYADKTIYSFPEMAKNMGTFTAAGIGLKDSAAAIKGIANLAAVSGSNSQQAATAMYQLSQALSSGTVKLMDWNSVVNAGMGGQVFQDALKETARVHGISIDDMIKKEGSFRNTLQEGWLSSEILTETLSKFTGDLTADQLKTMGYTEKQITEILKLGVVANDAATKVKTLSQLKETLNEAMSSGWAKSWQIVFGDFGEAKSFFTEVSDTLGGLVQQSSNARNKMLQEWKDFGGRLLLVETLRNAFKDIGLAIQPIKDAFKEIFPPTKSASLILWKLTFILWELSKSLKMGGETADRVKRIFKGIFAVFDILRMVVIALWDVFTNLISSFSGSGDGVLEFLARIGDFLVRVRDAIKTGDIFAGTIDKITKFIANAITPFKDFSFKLGLEFGKLRDGIDIFKEKFQEIFDFKKVNLSGVDKFFEKVKFRFAPLETLVKITAVIIGGLIKLLQLAVPLLEKMAPGLSKVLGGLSSAIAEGISTLDFSKLFDIINTGLLATLVLAVKSFLKTGKGTLGSISGMFSGITGTLDGVRGCLESYQKNLQAKTLLLIAGAIAILVGSLLVLSMIDSKKLTTALLGITTLFAELTASMNLMGRGGGLTGGAGLALTLMGMAVSLLLLTVALKSLADMDPDELQNGLVSLGALTAALAIFVKQISTTSSSFIRGAISLMLLGVALKIMVGVVKDLGAMDVETLRNGLISIGVILGELVIFMKTSNIDKMGVTKGLGLLALSAALLVMSTAIEKLGAMDPDQLQQGLIAIGAVLAEIAAFSQLTGKGIIGTAIGMTIIAASMLIFAVAIKNMGELSWEEIGKGLATMGGSLLIIATAMNLLPKNMIGSSIGLVLVGAAMLLLSKALKEMGDMDLKQIGRGLLVLGGSLTIITVAMMGMRGALPGAAALLIVSAALAILAPVLQQLGSMSITEIALALLTMAGVFVIFGAAGLILGPIVPVLLGLSVAITLLGVAIGLIGIGILAFSIGMSSLAISGTAGAIALVAMVGTIVGVVPLIVSTLANALIQFVVAIGAAAPEIGKALEALLLSLLKVIIDVTPELGKALTTLLQALFKLIRDNIPDFVLVVMDVLVAVLLFLKAAVPIIVQAAFDMLISFLSGIRDNLPEVVTTVGEIIIAFLDALGVEIPKIVDAGYKMLISLITGITDAINENQGPLNDAVAALAKAIITGLTDGILGSVKDVIAAVVSLGSGVIDALKTILGIASPSKPAKDIGKNFVKGFVNGLGDRTNTVGTAVENLADNALNKFAAAVATINDALNTSMQMYPSITPIVDLTDVLASGKDIESIFGGANLTMFGSLSKLSATAANMLGGINSEGKPGVPGSSSVTFNQNNYSPKALSSAEIYRQTRNQLLMTKGLIST